MWVDGRLGSLQDVHAAYDRVQGEPEGLEQRVIQELLDVRIHRAVVAMLMLLCATVEPG